MSITAKPKKKNKAKVKSKAKVVKLQVQEQAPVIKGLIKYDFGCGDRKVTPEHIGVDIGGSGADVNFNLFTFPYTFAPDGQADEIHASHFLEHVPMCYWNEGNEYTLVQKDENSIDLLEKLMLECHRILKVGGKMTVICPYYNSERAWRDPTHRRAISETTFLYFNRDWVVQNGLGHCHANSNFDFSYGYSLDGAIQTRNHEYQQYAIKHLTNAALDVIVTLTKK